MTFRQHHSLRRRSVHIFSSARTRIHSDRENNFSIFITLDFNRKQSSCWLHRDFHYQKKSFTSSKLRFWVRHKKSLLEPDHRLHRRISKYSTSKKILTIPSGDFSVVLARHSVALPRNFFRQHAIKRATEASSVGERNDQQKFHILRS